MTPAPCRLPGCWTLVDQPEGAGRPRHYCTDEHRREADTMRKRVVSRLAHMREQVRRDEHLLAALGGDERNGACSQEAAELHAKARAEVVERVDPRGLAESIAKALTPRGRWMELGWRGQSDVIERAESLIRAALTTEGATR